MKFWEKMRKFLYEACDIMEIFMALAVFAGIVIAAISIVPGFTEFWNHKEEAGAFMEFLDVVFGAVIGIEFMKMLCKPNTSSIIEALIFLMARHMIIETTTAFEDFLAILSISILFLLRRIMLVTKPDKNRRTLGLFRAIKTDKPSERPTEAEGAEDGETLGRKADIDDFGAEE